MTLKKSTILHLKNITLLEGIILLMVSNYDTFMSIKIINKQNHEQILPM